MKLKSPTDKPVHVALLSGHAISIGPEGREVAPMFAREALIAGAIPLGADESDMAAPLPASTEKDRAALIREGIKTMLEDGCDLTGSGLPKRNDLARLVGFAVTAEELAVAWHGLEAEASASEDGAS